MRQKLIVMSADALVVEDMELLETLPNFKKYLSRGARIKSVRSIYPTVTYPCHVTIATGCYPDRHGVTNNSVFLPGVLGGPWQWFSDVVKVPDIFDAAKAAGLTTAAVFWPVTGGHKSIDCLIAEYWPQSPEDTVEAAALRAGTKPELLGIIRKNLGENEEVIRARSHPAVDRFVIGCACDIIRRYAPDLIMVHPANIDAARHHSGIFGPKVDDSLRETDEFIGALFRAAEDAGVLDQTGFALVSDHGQLDIRRVVALNVLLADHGFIKTDADGNLLSWTAYCHSAGHSAQVYMRSPADLSEKSRLRALLCHLRDEGVYGISEVFETDEIRKKEHLSGDFSFVLEGDGYTSFSEAFTRPLVRNFDFTDYRSGRATHGYLPSKGPQPAFAAAGPAFRPGALLESSGIVNLAPTLAKALGFSMENTDGRPEYALLNLPLIPSR